MSLKDGVGLAGVALILVAYAGASLGRLDPRRAPALAANLLGASLILISLLTERFNLSACVMEGAWALVALLGLVRLARGSWSPSHWRWIKASAGKGSRFRRTSRFIRADSKAAANGS